MTGRTVRALLVGIDAYRPPVAPLHGCVRDVERVAGWLGARAAAAGDRLEPLILRDAEAGRQAVIDAVRGHLGAAGPDDVALLYYSGHGSQERAVRPEHLAVEPDGLNETLVLADSRHDGVTDLADKELAGLVSAVAGRAGHVLVVLDCCHSGSGVRAADDDGVAVRLAPADPRTRAVDSYLPEAGGTDATPGYVLLAACQPGQTAKEVLVDGVARGAFSVALERALAGLGGRPTYLDLQRTVAASVRNLAQAQWPVLETPHADGADRPFLGGAAGPAVPTLTVSRGADRRWVLDAGRLHGIGAPTPAQPCEVAVFPMTGDSDTEPDTEFDTGPGPLTTAAAVEVRAATTVLDVADPAALDPAVTYRARLVRAGQPLAEVAVSGTGPLADRVRHGLRASAVVRLADPPAAAPPAADLPATDLPATDAVTADLVLAEHAGRLILTRPGAARPLAADWDATDPATPGTAVRAAEHVGRWLGIAARQNPTGRLRADELRLEVRDPSGTGPGTELGAGGAPIEVRYGPDGTEPAIAVHLVNSSPRALHCAVLALSESYGVACLTVGGSVLLEPGTRTVVTDPDGRPVLRTFVPEGLERTTDLLVLFAGTEPFDAQTLAQDDLLPPARTRGQRGIGGRPVTPADGPDWATRQVLVTTVRPAPAQRVPSPDEGPLRLAPGVELLGHPGLRASARLAPDPAATRAPGAAPARWSALPPALGEPDTPNEPFAVDTARSAGAGLVLELDGVAGAGEVTPERPLRLGVDRPLAAGELVLPVAFDGQDYLPLGVGVADGGRTEIRLTRLPAGRPEQPDRDGAAARILGTRSLGGAVTILFRKLAAGRVGTAFPYPLLSLIDYTGTEPVYRSEPEAVRAAVRTATRVLVVVHGIIGDTRGMTGFLGAGPDPVRRHYDSVLAFDYESVHTRVPDTAAALAARIADAGLDTGNRVDVLAHSMGGLVGRWWVERAGGDKAVRRLVTCGTPHLGSPWPRAQDLATVGLALGLNGLGPLGTLLAGLVAAVEAGDHALDDMRPGSHVLDELAGSEAPDGVTYAAISGDLPFRGDSTNRAWRLLGKLGLPEQVLGMLFDGAPHDVAVAVTSAAGVGRSWPTPPARYDADCSHFEYFSAAPAVAAVRAALGLDPATG